jgi:Fe-S cluster assembly protein SufD
MSEIVTPQPLTITGEALRGLSREELRSRYEALPFPDTSEEHWRFTDLAGFDPEAFDAEPLPVGFEADSLLDPIELAALVTVTELGVEVEHADADLRVERLTDDHELLGTLVGADEKFAAHNASEWRNGLLVVIPKGVVLERPIYVRVANTAPAGSSFWRLLVVARPESRSTVIEEHVSASGELPSYSNAAVELFVEQAAKLEYVSIQNLSSETWHFASHRARVDRDAELEWVAGGFGSRSGKTRVQNDLVGPGASARVTGTYFADRSQHLDYDTFQEHVAPSTTSDFAFRGVLRDEASAVWRGMIRVEEGAQRTNAYQENRNLILSEKAHADSIPGLEILANDVRCTHGATNSPVNRDELFYCMARGLSRGEAERLIVRGFFQDMLDRIQLEPVREAVAQALEARIPAA